MGDSILEGQPNAVAKLRPEAARNLSKPLQELSACVGGVHLAMWQELVPLLVEALLIILALGGLEIVLWALDRKRQEAQTAALDKIATLLATHMPEQVAVLEDVAEELQYQNYEEEVKEEE